MDAEIKPTPCNEYYWKSICQYCGHSYDRQCHMGVPYYAVSLDCRFYTDQPIDVVARGSEVRRKLNLQKVLVETF
jgi:hypothetical protein